MGSSSQDTFQLWIIAKERGVVKRFECSIRKSVASVVASCSVVVIALAVLADYSRLAWQRASDGRTLQTALEQNQRLSSRNRMLRSEHREASNKLDRLEELTSTVLGSRRPVKEQLKELSSRLSTARGAGPEDVANTKSDVRPAVSRGNIDGAPSDALTRERGSPLDAIAQRVQEKSPTAKSKGGSKLQLAADSRKTTQPKTGLAMGGAEFPCTASKGRCGRGQSPTVSEPGQGSKVFPVEGDDQAAAVEAIRAQEVALSSLPLSMPSPGDITSLFGVRESPFGSGERMHEGLDISCRKGTPVSSTGDGRVIRVRRDSTYGRVIDIAHSEQLVTRYAHLSSIKVKVGDVVTRGQLIGLSGSSGHSTGPHLHYEVRVNSKAVDPLRFIQLAKNIREIVGPGTATALGDNTPPDDQWEAFG
jgi:murein DD-endopeptidase MepM/ murein hydrolase activator NlpD